MNRNDLFVGLILFPSYSKSFTKFLM